MNQKPSVVFDTSGLNQLLKESDTLSLVRRLKAEYFIRLTGTNVAEIAATPNALRRDALLTLCRSLADDYLFPYHWITNALISRYEENPEIFDWWDVVVEWPELEQELIRMEIFDDLLAEAQKKDHDSLNQDFKNLYVPGRPLIEQAFRTEPEGRPANFRQYLQSLKDEPDGEFLKKAKSFYRGPAKREPDERSLKRFLAICPPFRALVIAACVPEYEYWMRNLSTNQESLRAGPADLFSAVYLPYALRFVTHDDRQLNALRLVATHGEIGQVQALSYDELKKDLLSNTTRPAKCAMRMETDLRDP